MLWTRKALMLGCAGLAVATLSSCGFVTGDNARSELSTRLSDELTRRNFTNITLDKVVVNRTSTAEALVSAGGCRLRLDWNSNDGWKLHEGTKTEAGELTADMVKKLPPYVECAKLPAPSAPASKPA